MNLVLFLYNLAIRLRHLPALLSAAKAIEALLQGKSAQGYVYYKGVKLEVDVQAEPLQIVIKKV